MASIVIMGVSGTGKTTVGVALAERLVVPFVEGDKLHPAANVRKMSAGVPLTDDDRIPWLHAVGQLLHTLPNCIASCSALRLRYRDLLRQGAGGPVRFVCLVAKRDVLEQRMARRSHFMPASLLQSQLDTLELPLEEKDALIVDADAPLDAIVREIIRWIAASPPNG